MYVLLYCSLDSERSSSPPLPNTSQSAAVGAKVPGFVLQYCHLVDQAILLTELSLAKKHGCVLCSPESAELRISVLLSTYEPCWRFEASYFALAPQGNGASTGTHGSRIARRGHANWPPPLGWPTMMSPGYLLLLPSKLSSMPGLFMDVINVWNWCVACDGVAEHTTEVAVVFLSAF